MIAKSTHYNKKVVVPKNGSGVRMVFCALFASSFISFPSVAYAVLPPDLIVTVGSQIVGFFSLLIAVVISVCASLSMLYIGWYEKYRKYFVHFAFGILVLALMVSNGFYLWHINQAPAQVIPEYPSLTVATSTEDCQTCAFYSDSITLFVPNRDEPLVMELDLNRRQEPDGSFTHYYFLDGIFGSDTLDEYTQFSSNDYVLQSQSFLPDIQRIEPVDASVRDVYFGTVETATGETVGFKTEQLQGDFITRNQPEYTQFQSVAQATVQLAGVSQSAYVLVENLQSNNYQKRIFFPGMNTLEALTHQFVLWDEQGAFYMIDDSQVSSDTPAYPTHSWLLFKNATQQSTKKGFSTEIQKINPDQWRITVPDFSNGVIHVTTIKEYKHDVDDRFRYVVSGTVTDNNGTRNISGLLRIVR